MILVENLNVFIQLFFTFLVLLTEFASQGILEYHITSKLYVHDDGNSSKCVNYNKRWKKCTRKVSDENIAAMMGTENVKMLEYVKVHFGTHYLR